MTSVTPFQLDCLARAAGRAADFTNFAQDAAVGIAPFDPDAALDALTDAICSVVSGFDDDVDVASRPGVVWEKHLARALMGWPENDNVPPAGAA